MGKKAFSPTQYKFRHYAGDHLIWASTVGDIADRGIEKGSKEDEALLASLPFMPNALADEGEQLILDVFFRGATAPTNLFFRLSNSTPVETSTLASLTYVSGTGYAGISLARNSTDFPTLALDSGDYQTVTATKTFTAGGTWTTANHLVLATTSDNSGKLVAWEPLSTARTLVNGDSLAVTFTLKLS